MVNTEDAEKYRKYHDELLTSLFEQHGIKGRWAEFAGSNEGKALPGGLESESGKILIEDGRIFSFWLDWDTEKTAPDGTKGWYTLGENLFTGSAEDGKFAYFREIFPGKTGYPKLDDEAFLAAKKKLGLA